MHALEPAYTHAGVGDRASVCVRVCLSKSETLSMQQLEVLVKSKSNPDATQSSPLLQIVAIFN